MTEEAKTEPIQDIDSDEDIETIGAEAALADGPAAQAEVSGAEETEGVAASESAEPAEPEAPAVEPTEPAEPIEPERIAPRRQSLVLRSGSCDMRVGQDALDLLGQCLKAVSGKPRKTVIVEQAGTSDEVVELCRRSVIDAGYEVASLEAPAGRAARNIAFANTLTAKLVAEGITADDPIVVIGDGDAISGALYVSSTWRGGCVLAAVPTTLDAMVEVLPTPRALDLEGAQEALLAKGNVRLAICDIDIIPRDGATTLLGYAYMIATAVVSSKATFSDFAVCADKLLAWDPETVTKCIMDSSKARCRVASSTAIAMRQGVGYGQNFARALERCISSAEVDTERYAVDTNPCFAALVGEGLRIAARFAAAYKPEKSELLDMVFTQDGMLDKFGLKEVACVVDPEQFVSELRAVEFERSNRFMPAIPLDYGRVRLTTLDDEVIAEHIAAWCKSRRKLARRRAKELAQA